MDSANYYAGTTTPFGLFDYYGIPSKCYYALKAFSLMAELDERLPVHMSEAPGVCALAGRHADGSVRLLVTTFQTELTSMSIQTPFAKEPDECLRLDDALNLEAGSGPKLEDGLLQLSISQANTITLLIWKN